MTKPKLTEIEHGVYAQLEEVGAIKWPISDKTWAALKHLYFDISNAALTKTLNRLVKKGYAEFIDHSYSYHKGWKIKEGG